jgi:hypothetical protein
MTTNLAIVAKDSRALSPARASLAHLLHQAEQLRREVEPLYEQLRRCDQATARADRALVARDALLAEHEIEIADAVLSLAPPPEPPQALDEAEIELRAANSAAKAVITVRDQINAAMQSAHERGAAIQREVAAVTAQILVDEAVEIANRGYRGAFRAMRRQLALVEGVHEHLRATMQLHAVEQLEKHLKVIRSELASDKTPNAAEVQRFIEALGRDPSAELEVE